MIIQSMADLMSPHDPALIDAAMRDRRRLHLSTERAAAYAALLPLELLNTLPTAERLFSSDMRVVQRGRDAPLEMAAPRTAPAEPRTIAPEFLQGLCEQGMSLIFNGVDDHVPAVTALTAMVERHFGAVVKANCYASFVRAGAFAPHFDSHDVIVLQLDGTKKWFCHGQPHHYPVARAGFAVPDDLGDPECVVEMKPGDLLFLPRGEVHSATVDSDRSIHLAIAVHQSRGPELMRWLGRALEHCDVGRENILRDESAGARADRTERLRAALHQLADGLDLDRFLDWSDRERSPALRMNLGFTRDIRAETMIQPALRRRVPLVVGTNTFGAVSAKLDAGECAVLACLLEREAMPFAALADALPEHAPEALRAAVAGLARKALVTLYSNG